MASYPSNLRCRMHGYHPRDLQNGRPSCCVQMDRCKTAAGHDVSIFFQQPACDKATCKRLIRAMYLSTVGSMVGWARFRTWRDLHHPATDPQAKYRIPGSKPVRT